MAQLKYVAGDATNPQVAGNKVIIHCCNGLGLWGKGFVLAISRRWKAPEKAYREWYKSRATNDFALGAVQFVQVEDDTWVGNMIGQFGVYEFEGFPPIRYDAVRECLVKVREFAKAKNATITSPRFGSGYALGEWDKIEAIINEELVAHGIEVVIHDLA